MQRIHDKYLLKNFLRIFLISVFTFTIIYVIVNVFEEIDNFIDHDATILEIARYYLFSIPFVLTYIIPVSLLLATLFSMGVMARRNELTALLASGVSLVRVAAPILVFSLLVGAVSIYFNDVVVARANRTKESIKTYEIENRPRPDNDVKEGFVYQGEGGRTYLADSYRHATKTLYDVVVQEFSGNTLKRRIDAKRAHFNGTVWVFEDGYVRTFAQSGETIAPFDEMPVPEITERPEDFAREEANDENMNFMELRRYVNRLRRTGGKVEKYVVDMYFKFSFPFAGTIFVLIGVAFASGKRKQSVAAGFGVTLMVSFLYYTVLRIGQTLGHNGVLPPLLAAQFGNIIFLAIGATLLHRANR